MEETQKIKYLSFGSPLMDIVADVSDEFLEQNQIGLNTAIHKKRNEIAFYGSFVALADVKEIPGGCQFNAMRVFNWMNQDNDKEKVGFLGSVGDDKEGETYQTLLEKENIVPIFETIPNKLTGICLVACNNRDRAHITDLGASTSISQDFVERKWSEFKDVSLIYTELFIIQDKKEVALQLAELGSQDDKKYGFNLPATFFLEKFTSDIKDLVSYADIIFSNEVEAKFFCEVTDQDLSVSSIEAYAKCIAKMQKKNENKNRVVVVTSGPNDAWVCEYNFKERKFEDSFGVPVKDISEEKIIDTNGAGDAFAGGFLSRYMKGKSLKSCMKAGHWASSIIIQERGFNFPPELKYEDEDEY